MSAPWVNGNNAALLTDLYELTMLQSYFDQQMRAIAVFDLFVRRLPASRNYLIACGLEHVLTYLENLSFSDDAIAYLRTLGRFSGSFLESLRHFSFSGDVYAMPEGTVFFANEPILEIVAPLPEAQLIETFVINQIQLPTMAASKASRVVTAAKGRPVIDYGLRRIHGADAGIKASRAFYIAGVDATSNVLAGEIFGLPVSGTMAHSYVQAFDDERDAFRRFVRSFDSTTLLVDTYDTITGVGHVVELAKELGPEFRVGGVRLDSGDLGALATESRRLLDGAGLQHVKIFASSSLDEYSIDNLVRSGAPIDGFGVGVHMGSSDDAPFLDAVYKLSEYDGRPRVKLSAEKSNLPGRKQVFRSEKSGKFEFDTIGRFDEAGPGEPLLVKVMESGRRRLPAPSVEEARSRCRRQLRSIPADLMRLQAAASPYPVRISEQLELSLTTLRRRLTQKDRA